MQVGLNTAITLRGSSGTARVVALIASALTAGGHDVQLRKPHHRRGSKLGNAARATWWDFVGFDRSTQAEVLISPTNVGWAGSGRPLVLWVHDTMVLDHPGWFDRAYALHARATFGPSVRAATAVVTPSEDARSRIAARWPASASKLHVIPWPSPDVVTSPRRTLPDTPTVLMLGATEPHKRHTLGIEVVRLLRLRTSKDVRLRVVGPPGRAESAVVEMLAEVDPLAAWTRREFLNSWNEVEQALSDAWCLLQCSLDEGFCLPLVESAARALPAVHTGGGSMAEVHPPGNARTDNAHELAQALERLLDLDAYCVASGLARRVALESTLEQFQAAVCSVVEGALDANRSPARE
jgi:glycosyltransferase involved in cell wall biosynthesis